MWNLIVSVPDLCLSLYFTKNQGNEIAFGLENLVALFKSSGKVRNRFFKVPT